MCPRPQSISDIGILDALHRCFNGDENELNKVRFEAAMNEVELIRKTKIVMDGSIRRESKQPRSVDPSMNYASGSRLKRVPYRW